MSDVICLKTRKLNLEFKNLHYYEDCGGSFRPIAKESLFHNIHGLGPVELRSIPMVRCDRCGSLYFHPGLEQEMKTAFYEEILESGRILGRREIKFLRVYANLSVEQISEMIGLEDKSEFENYVTYAHQDYPTSRMQQKIFSLFKTLGPYEDGLCFKPSVDRSQKGMSYEYLGVYPSLSDRKWTEIITRKRYSSVLADTE